MSDPAVFETRLIENAPWRTGIRPILIANAAFSFFSGSTMLLAQNWLTGIFPGAPGFLFPLLGAGLILFAIDILFHLWRGNLSIKKGWYFTLSDLGWVIGSVLILANLESLLPLGRILIWSTAALVFLFSALQGWQLITSHKTLTTFNG